MDKQNLNWISVGHVQDLPEGRVKTVTARTTSICLVHFEGQGLSPLIRQHRM
jgi:pyruvate oxidase